MKILIITSIYKANDIPKEFTSVVHYFALEWKALGHDVYVVHNLSFYNRFLYIFSFFFKNLISSITGTYLQTKRISKKKEYCIDGINVYRLPIYKTFPYTKFKTKRLNNQTDHIIKKLTSINFSPDLMVGHWGNPQLKILKKLSLNFKSAKTALVLHSNWKHLYNTYKKTFHDDLESIQYLGFRNQYNMNSFTKEIDIKIKTFLCYSGIPNYFYSKRPKIIFPTFKSFIFVGSLMKRKYPHIILNPLKNIFGAKFKMNFIGNGFYLKKIKSQTVNLALNQVGIHRSMKRKDLIKFYDESDCIIMVSKNEAFGLVILEAMSRGCIPIISKNESLDGIVIDGVNGFLSLAGDESQLEATLSKISQLDEDKVLDIKKNAMKTAKLYSNINVAKSYLDNFY